MTLQIKKWGDWLRNSRDFTRQKGADYEPRLPGKDTVVVENVGKLAFSEAKLKRRCIIGTRDIWVI